MDDTNFFIGVDILDCGNCDRKKILEAFTQYGIIVVDSKPIHAPIPNVGFPIIYGTTGEMETGEDLKEMFFNSDYFNLIKLEANG
jgi:hypothetical protein